MAESGLEGAGCLLIPKSDVEFGDVIGRGGFSQVWATKLKISGNVIPAAAKKVP